MRKLLLLLLLLPAAILAVTESEETFTSQTQAGVAELFTNWRVLSMLAIFISVILVGIGFAVGIGMEMPEVKAWASNELVQIFANLLIIVTLMVSIGILDVTAEQITQQSGITVDPPCTGGQSCLGNVAVTYLQQYIDAANADARKVAIDAIDASGWANRRFGIYCTSILCLQIGTSFSIMGYWMLDQDRYQIVFEYYTNLLSSLEAQKFFVTNISFKVGPLLLAAGIVGRSFFFTRKVGGLLIAVAAGIMFFLPGMYIFDWVTLDTTLTGDKNAEGDLGYECPEECAIPVPMAVIENGTSDIQLGSPKAIYDAFPDEEAKAQQVLLGQANSSPLNGPFAGKNVITCMAIPPLKPDGFDQLPFPHCPMSCRELPYPSGIPDCMNLSNSVPQTCAQLPDKCWVRRYASDPPEPEPGQKVPLTQCPVECKVVPPLKGNCDTGNCLISRPECRVYKRINDTGSIATDLEWSPNPPKDASLDQYLRCTMAEDCDPSFDALQSCSYIIPDTSSCSQLCEGCDEVCRVLTDDINNLPSQCINGSVLPIACQNCPVGCKVNSTYIAEVSPDACTGCAAEKRIVTYGSTMPSDYITGACDIETSCPTEERVPIPRNACEQCLFSDESQIYTPPIQASCTDLCRPPEAMVAKSPDKFTGVGAEGLVGPEEVKNVSKLMLPAYVLPLFNIVATLVFIKGLSNVLGGDIEIPGVSKVF
ncbi:MAG: hypothetical protein AB1324_07905 [Candidatus Micrarchaeota archaeon]